MTDRELLELAAKAAGAYRLTKDLYQVDGSDWNPLTDDGDAFRLAVKLKLTITVYGTETLVVYGDGEKIYEEGRSDLYAASRYAIVRAAAEIGKEMK